MNFVFIINPIAGIREATDEILPKIKKFAQRHSVQCDIMLTEHSTHAIELARNASESYEKVRIVACGGDGTLNEVARGILESGNKNAELCSYPCGSGNDFIKYFGDANDFKKLDYIVDSPSKLIDVMKVNDRICINIVSVGLDADVAYSAKSLRRIPVLGGKSAYTFALIKSMLGPVGKELEIELDGEKSSGNYTFVAAANGRVYGGGYNAAPSAQVDDGLIDAISIDKLPLTRLVGFASAYKKGEHLNGTSVSEAFADCTKFSRVKKLSMKSDKDFFVNIDGEVEVMKTIDISIMPKVIGFVSPYAE